MCLTDSIERALFQNQIVAMLVRKFPVFMEPESSLPCSQETAPLVPILSHKNTVHIIKYITSLIYNLILSSHLYQYFPNGLFSSGFTIKIAYIFLIFPIAAT
jgi:hypothetical protein